MFRIELFVEDKNLALALRGIAGLALGQPNVQPVVNAKLSERGVVAEDKGGRLIDLFVAHLRASSHATISTKDVQTFLRIHGRNPSSAAYLLGLAQKAGAIRKDPKTKGPVSLYQVLAGDKK